MAIKVNIQKESNKQVLCFLTGSWQTYLTPPLDPYTFFELSIYENKGFKDLKTKNSCNDECCKRLCRWFYSPSKHLLSPELEGGLIFKRENDTVLRHASNNKM